MSARPAFLGALLLITVSAPLGGQGTMSEPPSPTTTFFTYYRTPTGPIVGAAGVEVLRIGRDGVDLLGTTDVDGEIVLRAEDMFGGRGIALLFCDPKALKEHCAAIRVDTAFFRGFEEYNVELLVPSLINRVRIVPAVP